MRDINLKHLHYFWAVAHQGSIAAASEHLFVTPQTISAQLKELESSLGHKLFRRSGKSLSLSQAGETALSYADGIFDLRRELAAALATENQDMRQIRVGISDVVPKLIASRVLLPAIQHEPAPRLICKEGESSELLAALAQHKLDMVISDHPAAPDPNLRLYSHKMGSTGISFMAAPKLISDENAKFPACLDQQPILMPGRHTALRMTLESWLQEQKLDMHITGEFDDSALTKAFGQLGAGLFTCPSAIQEDVRQQYGVRELGRTKAIRESFYLISPNKRISQPLILQILQRAREEVFKSG